MYSVSKLDSFTPEVLDRSAGELLAALESEAGSVSRETEWEAFRNRWIARKNGILTQINELWLKAAPGEAKREVGRRVNELKARVEATVEERRKAAGASRTPTARVKVTMSAREAPDTMAASVTVEQGALDVTLPGILRPLGAQHPVMRVMGEIVSVFKAMGYSIGQGPEIESDYYNFESLNFPPEHPARDMQDTIFIAGQERRPQRERLLLRTHTSPVQIRTMEKQRPPLRIVIPGKCYRHDTPDLTHSPVFHQVEGLAVDTNITFCDLKGTLDHAMKALFGASVRTRFRPSFFPFTEPSAEVLISCIFCGGKGFRGTERCPTCKQSGWVELLGSGMVDPALYGFVGYDAAKYSGFAFGMGVERVTMFIYGIEDINLFYQGDVRFLQQFA